MNYLTTKVLPRSVAEICPGLYSVHGMIELAGRRLSWIADDSRGFLPLHVYVLRDEKALLLVDTGTGAHKPQIEEGFTYLMDGIADRRLFVTRREPDSFVNFSWVVQTFGINRIYYAGELNPLNLFERFEATAGEMQLHHLYKGAVENIQPGLSFEVGRLRIKMVKSAIRLIAAIWAFEETTGTLFTSDSFAFVTVPQASSSPIVKPSDDEISAERIFGYLDKKFDWLRGVDPEPFKAELRAIAEGQRIERLCPTYGAVIEGRAAVQKVFAGTITALDRIAALKPRRAMEGFGLPRV
jgi:hypothetical protein